MRIKGLQKTSLIDYPGKMAAVVFTPGCDFRCPFCHNVELVLEPDSLPDIEMAGLLKFLGGRKKWIDGVVITGGEPCLQPDLGEFISHIKNLGLKVKLDTNGSLPDVLGKLIQEGSLDFIAMDVKAPLKGYKRAAGVDVDTGKIMQSIRLIIDSGIGHEFRTTVLPKLHAREDVVEIARMLCGADRYVIQQFRNLKTLDPAYRECRRFTPDELEWMRAECIKYVPTEIRR